MPKANRMTRARGTRGAKQHLTVSGGTGAAITSVGGRRMRTPEAARYLALSESTLEKDRCSGALEIPFHKLGRAVVYDAAELDAWLVARRQTNTSQTAAE